MHFTIKNMTCGSCVRRIDAAIHGVDANAKVKADTAARRIEVETAASQRDIEEALTAAGYEAALIS